MKQQNPFKDQIRYKACVFDLDGVLRIGKDPVPGTEMTLKHLDERGVKTMIVTNECRYSVSELREELDDIGVHVPTSTVVYTAACAARDYLETKLKRSPDKKFKVCVMGEIGLVETITELNTYSNFTYDCRLNDEADRDKKLYVVLGTVNTIKKMYLERLLEWIKRGAGIITTCGDLSDPSSKGDFNLIMPSHTLHLISYNSSKKVRSYSTGKPNPRVGRYIHESLGIEDPEEILFIGDTIYTDIKMAEESGFKSCLVLSGNTNRNTMKAYVIEPDHVLDDVTQLNNIL